MRGVCIRNGQLSIVLLGFATLRSLEAFNVRAYGMHNLNAAVWMQIDLNGDGQMQFNEFETISCTDFKAWRLD
jgi:hypothetical protein